MDVGIVPKDSLLRLWLKSLSITENPIGYQVIGGLSSIGALMKRSVFVDQVKWRVYPNLSVFFVGPSGVGKDTIINECIKLINAINPTLQFNADTIEAIKAELVARGDPAAAYIPMPEITGVMGGKDYQKGIAATLTDLLSTNPVYRFGNKSEGAQTIYRPTVTIHAGSTPEWLKNLPENSISGGFLPRFLIVCADAPAKYVAWVKYDTDVRERREAEKAGKEFVEGVREVVMKYGKVHQQKDEWEMIPTPAAEEYYRNWYHNRFRYFSENVRAYANRSRDHMHRLAMLMALTRGHGWMDEVDYQFAANVIDFVAAGIDKVVAPMLGLVRRKG